MIKSNCERCGKPYLGESCACLRGKKPSALGCDCGEQAVAVWVDEFGEWALCRTCLSLAEEESAQMPTPRWYRKSPLPTDDGNPPAESGEGLPFGLTWREYQVACLAHYPNKQIAETLGLSQSTVHSHLKQIFRKLGIRSRFEIPFILPRAKEQESGGDFYLSKLISSASEGNDGIGRPTITLSITLPNCAMDLRELLAWLMRDAQEE